jgi:large conductance mechanosensitive channel
LLKGFKNFIARGNVIDLAVGVIIGAAFGGIVDSLTKDIITPIIGLLGGQPDFSAIKPFGIGIGNFVNAVISFLIKAAGLYFLIVLPFNRFAVKLAPEPAVTPSERLLTDIRDILSRQSTVIVK